MKKNLLFVLSLLLTGTIFAQYSGGEGTASAPYKIKYVKDLIELSENNKTSDFTDVYFQLENDIDFKAEGKDSSVYYIPLGELQNEDRKAFNGYFNGQRNII